MRTKAILSAIALLSLVGCSKDYIVHTEQDKQGNSFKVVSTQEVLHDNSLLFGQDVTTEIPLTCKPSAIGWKGQLDKEQCSREHVHLTGVNKGMTHYARTVHTSDTLGKKLLPTFGMFALWGWVTSAFSNGGQTQGQNQNTTVNTTGVTQNCYSRDCY